RGCFPTCRNALCSPPRNRELIFTKQGRAIASICMDDESTLPAMNSAEESPNGSTAGDATPRRAPDWLSEPTLREGTKILLPVDFSEAAIEALWYAKRLAQAFHTRLALLHVVEP